MIDWDEFEYFTGLFGAYHIAEDVFNKPSVVNKEVSLPVEKQVEKNVFATPPQSIEQPCEPQSEGFLSHQEIQKAVDSASQESEDIEDLNPADPPHPRPNQSSRPTSWDDFVGTSNHAVVDRLKMAITASKKENRVLSHTMLFGGPGLGKTTLSLILANETNAELIETVGSSISKQEDIYALFCDIQRIQDSGKKAILFIDEIHDIARKDVPETVWFPIFEDFIFHHSLRNSNIVIDGERGMVTSSSAYLEPFTIIGATTDPGELSQPLRDRFPVQCYLLPYTVEDLAEILKRYAARRKIEIDHAACLSIAGRARGTPRTAINFLLACRDRALVGDTTINADIVKSQMDMDCVDEEGLTQLDFKVLTALANAKKGLGIANLSGSAGVNRSTIEEIVEPFLKQKGYMHTTHRRFITEKGVSLLVGKKIIENVVLSESNS